MIEAQLLKEITGLSHGFFTREGGYSSGSFSSLNCGYGSGDDLKTVARNRAVVADALSVGSHNLLTVYQEHSPKVVTVTETWTPRSAPTADAMVTKQPGVAIGVLTADCAPVLFAERNAKVIAVAHAGWKGALTGVTDATIRAMEALGADRAKIAAVIGPAISADAYEVGPEFHRRFLDADEANAVFFKPARRKGHFMFNLPGYLSARLRQAGIASVANLALCTYTDEKRFFSYRRASHRSETEYGRLISAIAIAP
jgi:YfiH family protein